MFIIKTMSYLLIQKYLTVTKNLIIRKKVSVFVIIYLPNNVSNATFLSEDYFCNAVVSYLHIFEKL